MASRKGISASKNNRSETSATGERFQLFPESQVKTAWAIAQMKNPIAIHSQAGRSRCRSCVLRQMQQRPATKAIAAVQLFENRAFPGNRKSRQPRSRTGLVVLIRSPCKCQWYVNRISGYLNNTLVPILNQERKRLGEWNCSCRRVRC
jgi:hypothetical protein